VRPSDENATDVTSGTALAAGGQFTMPPTKVTGSTIAMVNDTCAVGPLQR